MEFQILRPIALKVDKQGSTLPEKAPFLKAVRLITRTVFGNIKNEKRA